MKDKKKLPKKKSIPDPKKSKKELSDKFHRESTDSVFKALDNLK